MLLRGWRRSGARTWMARRSANRHVCQRCASAASSGMLHPTSLRLALPTKEETFDFIFRAEDERLDMSLFEDPNAGLSLTEATEMSERDVIKELTSSAHTWDPVGYTIVFTPLVDLVQIISDNNLMPVTKQPEVTLSQWLSDPRALLGNQGMKQLAESWGPEQWPVVVECLKRWQSELEALSPLQRVASHYNVPADTLLVPALRVVGQHLWSRSWEVKHHCVQQLPSLVLGLAGGKGESVAPVAPLHAADSNLRRTQMIGEMLVALGQETGNASPAFLGIQLLRANHIRVPYRTQKALTNVFSAVQRIKTDWDLRYSGASRQAIPKWIKTYLKLAERDAARASSEAFRSHLSASERSPSNVVVALDDDGSVASSSLAPPPAADVAGYFQRRVNKDVVAMRENIAKKLEAQHQRLQQTAAEEEAAQSEGNAASAMTSESRRKKVGGAKRGPKPKSVTL